MVDICLKEQLAKQILYVFPSILNDIDGELDHEVFVTKNDIYKQYITSEITSTVLEDKNKIENIWCVIQWTLSTDVGKNMSDYIK